MNPDYSHCAYDSAGDGDGSKKDTLHGYLSLFCGCNRTMASAYVGDTAKNVKRWISTLQVVSSPKSPPSV
jgi:hypothetical protein